jgi:hypothetical protein
MGIATKRKICPRGNRGASNSVIIPANIKTGKIATIAANRLLLIDPRGEIDENSLLELLETFIEPNLWPLLKKKPETHARIERSLENMKKAAAQAESLFR